jgi:hypothetical protein
VTLEPPCFFSTSWFDTFKKRHWIVHCQVRGETGSVDQVAIEPELAKIRQLCATYDPENIYKCDETDLYLREPNSKSYTTVGNIARAKADRSGRIHILFCNNAAGSSILKADTIDALKPWLLCK